MNQFESLTDQTLLTMLAWGEARGEGPVGMLGVCWVAKNRSDQQKRALKDVILQPYQFSCFNQDDPYHKELWHGKRIEPFQWGQADTVARLVLAGYTIDPTGGATHYYAVSIPAPSWAKEWTELTQIGHHIFGVA